MSRWRSLVKRGWEGLMQPAEDPRPEEWKVRDEHGELLRQVASAKSSLVQTRLQSEHRHGVMVADLQRLEAHALAEIQTGREATARQLLQQYHALEAELSELEKQHAALAREEIRLGSLEQQLASRIETNARRMRLASAQSTAAGAQVRAGEALVRAATLDFDTAREPNAQEEFAAQLEARAAAIERLIDEGALGSSAPGLISSNAEQIERHLEYLRSRTNQGRNPS